MLGNFLIGIDLGGTKVAAAAFDLDGNRLGRVARLPTMADRPADVTLMNVVRVVKQARSEAGVDGDPRAIGMGSSGPLDPEARVLHDKDSLPGLVGFNMGRFCQAEFGAPLHLENDASCFALGEAVRGAGRSHRIVLGATLGTGFGCGISMDGRIYSGATNNAGEVAYCRVGDTDFDHACSGEAVVRHYAQQVGTSGEAGLGSKEIGDRAEEGEEAALEAWRSYGADVGVALATVCSVLDPHRVVLGGSVSKRFGLFEGALLESARRILLGSARESFQVHLSELGDAAGLTGAAEHARQHLAS